VIAMPVLAALAKNEALTRSVDTRVPRTTRTIGPVVSRRANPPQHGVGSRRERSEKT